MWSIGSAVGADHPTGTKRRLSQIAPELAAPQHPEPARPDRTFQVTGPGGIH